MKILLIANYRQGVGGISGQVAALQRHLEEEGNTADIFSTKGSIRKRLAMLSRLNRLTREYDVIHIHCCSGWGFLPAVIGVCAAKKNGKHTLLTYHGGGAESFFSKHKRLVKHFLLRTDRNIVLSGFLGRIFDQYQIPYVIIPNIVELNPALFRERIVLQPDYICIRSHEKIYNIPCILKAFKIVQNRIPRARLTLLGDGSLHEELMRQCSDMELKNVDFAGKVDNDVIYDYLDQSDIMVSAPNVDNMPVSILEAMNAGLLVISSNVGGVPYIINDAENGLLFPANDPVALAQRMLWPFENMPEALGMIKSAHEGVSDYTWANIRSKVLSAYSV